MLIMNLRLQQGVPKVNLHLDFLVIFTQLTTFGLQLGWTCIISITILDLLEIYHSHGFLDEGSRLHLLINLNFHLYFNVHGYPVLIRYLDFFLFRILPIILSVTNLLISSNASFTRLRQAKRSSKIRKKSQLNISEDFFRDKVFYPCR